MRSIRQLGGKRLETWLRNRKVLRADRLAEVAVLAAERQHTSLPGEKLTAQLVHTLAKEVMALNQQVAELDKLIKARFRDHHTFDVITSMPGLGIILGAEFLAATGGDMTVFGTPDRLAGFGGVAPVPRDPARSAETYAAPAIQPQAPARLLHFRTLQHPEVRGIPPLLRSQTRRRQTPHPGRPRSRPPSRQRPLGTPPRRTVLRTHPTERSRGLTDGIRNR